jgi:hypothetical protein
LSNTVRFVRYADDAIVHCKGQRQAEWILARIEERMQSCGLELHPEKTKIAYCRDHRRKENYSQVKFDFGDTVFSHAPVNRKEMESYFLDLTVQSASAQRNGLPIRWKN